MTPRPHPADDLAIRPIRSDDTDRLRAHHDRLSPQSRYRRFLSAKPALSGADVRYLVEIDGRDHVALVATRPEPDGADERIVAVARFIRLPGDGRVAEMAIVVNDDDQRRGVGSELVARLAQAAVARGVCRFQATMLHENLGIRRLLEGLAAGPVQYRWLGGLCEMELPLPGADAASPGCADAVLAGV